METENKTIEEDKMEAIDGTNLGQFTEGEPDGTVSDEDKVEDKGTDIKGEEVEVEDADSEPTGAENLDWDVNRQRADQAEANLRKIQAERDNMSSAIGEANRKVEQLQSQLDKYAQVQDVNLDAIDPDLVEPSVINILKSMQARIDVANRKAAVLEEKALNYEQDIRSKAEASARDKAKTEVVRDIETEKNDKGELLFSPKHRNQAIKMANEICQKRGYSPRDRYEAARILRQCYMKLATGSKGKTVSTDTGKSTVVGQSTNDVKPGSLREVAAQLRKKAGL